MIYRKVPRGTYAQKARHHRDGRGRGRRRIYTIRKCRVCGVHFVLGPLDPDVEVCPIHAYTLLKKSE